MNDFLFPRTLYPTANISLHYLKYLFKLNFSTSVLNCALGDKCRGMKENGCWEPLVSVISRRYFSGKVLSSFYCINYLDTSLNRVLLIWI
jgi:hypothetical protein